MSNQTIQGLVSVQVHGLRAPQGPCSSLSTLRIRSQVPGHHRGWHRLYPTATVAAAAGMVCAFECVPAMGVGLLGLVATSLVGCTATIQLPG